MNPIKNIPLVVAEGNFGPNPEYCFHVIFGAPILTTEFKIETANNWFAEIGGVACRVVSFKTGAERTHFLLTYDL